MIKENQELLENREKLDELDEGGHSRRLAKRNHHPLMEEERQAKWLCKVPGNNSSLSTW